MLLDPDTTRPQSPSASGGEIAPACACWIDGTVASLRASVTAHQAMVFNNGRAEISA
ncbi:MAG: hypothetical protein AB7Q97_22870 [Gammaproteobacteria bacterium]